MTDYVKPPGNRPVLVADPDARRDAIEEEGTAEETAAKRDAAVAEKARQEQLANSGRGGRPSVDGGGPARADSRGAPSGPGA
ncbi:hypothetical protein M2282_006012 [Variovorax boronicumulans]|uniref:hypothetical protein n=1 Tax=Variovorax boronicumulans TaxID=436515 RepID=UPI002475B323|nr:hypothetical protein [Variovorax boronicumulans]MDH6170832.1 hypothetical protein [Variovorax boronicumulans]